MVAAYPQELQVGGVAVDKWHWSTSAACSYSQASLYAAGPQRGELSVSLEGTFSRHGPVPLGVQLHFWGEALPGPLLQTPGDWAVHPIACSLGTFARFLQDMQAVQVRPSFTETMSCQLDLYLLSPVRGPPRHASRKSLQCFLPPSQRDRTSANPHPRCWLTRDG